MLTQETLHFSWTFAMHCLLSLRAAPVLRRGPRAIYYAHSPPLECLQAPIPAVRSWAGTDKHEEHNDTWHLRDRRRPAVKSVASNMTRELNKASTQNADSRDIGRKCRRGNEVKE